MSAKTRDEIIVRVSLYINETMTVSPVVLVDMRYGMEAKAVNQLKVYLEGWILLSLISELTNMVHVKYMPVSVHTQYIFVSFFQPSTHASRTLGDYVHFRGCKCAFESKLAGDSFYTMSGVNVFNKGNLKASCRTLSGYYRGIREKIFPDLSR